LRVATILIHELRLLPPLNNQEEYHRPSACCALNEDPLYRIRRKAALSPEAARDFYPTLWTKRSAREVMAGITVGLIALPLALALGIASIPPGTQTSYPPPAVGLFTAIFAGLVISSLGGSRVQIGGPTAAFIPIVLLIIEKYGYSGLILATLMAGGILVVMGLARMGTLIKFIPWPVTSGFTTGLAVSIMATQVADFLGIRAETAAPREFLHKLHWIWENLSHCHPPSMGLAFACVLLIGLWPRLGMKRIPGSIVAMLATAAAVAAFGLEQKLGLDTIGSKFGPGAIPLGLPPFQWPDISLEHIRSLIEPAMTIAVLGAIESLLSAVVADGLSGDRHDSNTELIAQGIANIVCPFFGGLPATGAIARTSANVNNGGRTPVAGITQQPHASACGTGFRQPCYLHSGCGDVCRARDGRGSHGRMARVHASSSHGPQ
jgi:SulP family sulfate permease